MECLEHNNDCKGEVTYIYLGGTKAWPRCEYHGELRIKEEARIRERYPDNAPSDFDSAYAGERWDDEY